MIDIKLEEVGFTIQFFLKNQKLKEMSKLKKRKNLQKYKKILKKFLIISKVKAF